MKLVRITKSIVINNDANFSNICFQIDCDVGIKIQSCIANFQACQFKGKSISTLIYAQNAFLTFKDCAMHDSLVAININNSNAKIQHCLVSNIYENFIIANKSKINITNSKISQLNAEVSAAFIHIENSDLSMLHTDISDGLNATAIYAKSSKINLNNMNIFNNQESALHLENSQFLISTIKIYNNGSFVEDFSQIYCENSKGTLERAFIFNGINSNAITITKTSHIKILNSFIYKNNLGVYLDRLSNVTIFNCKFFTNAEDLEEGIQIWIDNAKISIIGTKIFDNKLVTAIYAQKDAHVFLNDCKIYSNKFAIKAYYLAKLKLKNCSIFNNLEAIIFENADILIENTNISAS